MIGGREGREKENKNKGEKERDLLKGRYKENGKWEKKKIIRYITDFAHKLKINEWRAKNISSAMDNRSCYQKVTPNESSKYQEKMLIQIMRNLLISVICFQTLVGIL